MTIRIGWSISSLNHAFLNRKKFYELVFTSLGRGPNTGIDSDFFDMTHSNSIDEQVEIESRKTFIAVLMMNCDKSLPLVERIKLHTSILLK